MDYLSICLICKDENDYLAEWLDYHIVMGVDRFYIYDNESRISLRETLKTYIEQGWVVVQDIPGRAMQLHAYDHCLRTFGPKTVWLGFIDTDEFLVSKTTLDLKELLKEYEAYGGLAVSSLFFGSGGQKERPLAGQAAGYLWRTHETFSENKLIKSIVRPSLALFPNSPHDFIYKENAWCVNEDFKRVDHQRFPNYTQKIQLNHYFCRSESETEQKLNRGRGDAGKPWERARFQATNLLASHKDTTIIQNLERLWLASGLSSSGDSQHTLLERMALLAQARQPSAPPSSPSEVVLPAPRISEITQLKNQLKEADKHKDYARVKQLNAAMLQIAPQNVALYLDLMGLGFAFNDPDAAWQAIAHAWRLAPNSFLVLGGMDQFFLQVRNFEMAEKTARLLLEIAPHDLKALGFLAEALLGLGRFDEAIKIGVPVVELATKYGEMYDKKGLPLIRAMANYLVGQKDYAAAAHLWEVSLPGREDDVEILLELANALLLLGDREAAYQRLLQAQASSPGSPDVAKMLRQIGLSQPGKRSRH